MALAYQSYPVNRSSHIMYGQQPWYLNYPSNVSYNPHLHPSYQRPSPFDPVPALNPRGYGNDRLADERRRTLAERRARRAQWLPEEVDEDEDDDWNYGNYGQSEPSYLEAKRRLQEEERVRRLREEALRRQEEQQRQQILLQKQKEEEQAKQRMWGEQRQQTLRREEEERRRLAEQDKTTPEVCVEPTLNPESTSQTTKPQPSIEEQHKAAGRIQQQYRVHAANRALDKVAQDFEKLKKNFVYPRAIDFQKPSAPGEHVGVPANRPPSEFDKEPEDGEGAPMDIEGEQGKLAYTSTNYPLHSYVDAMDKLLMRLDGVESAGKKGIREKRRRIVKDVEKEASKLERYWKQAWVDYARSNPLQQSGDPASTASEPVMDETCPNFG